MIIQNFCFLTDQTMLINFTCQNMLFVQLKKQQRYYSILKNVARLKNNDFVVSVKIISEHIHGRSTQKVAKAFIAYTVLYFLCL